MRLVGSSSGALFVPSIIDDLLQTRQHARQNLLFLGCAKFHQDLQKFAYSVIAEPAGPQKYPILTLSYILTSLYPIICPTFSAMSPENTFNY